MAEKTIVIALGGNAIKQSDQDGTTEEQVANVDVTARQVVSIMENGYRVVITHGNGPQAGNLLIQQEEAADLVPPQDLTVCGAMTQGQIGWMIQNRIGYHLQKRGIYKNAVSIVTQVCVDKQDPDFQDPSKPVGPYYTKEQAELLHRKKGYVVREVKPGSSRPWRRVVPSPEPLEIVEKSAITSLLNQGFIVVASGGGGIPVTQNGDGCYTGVNAVIDKDKAGFKLAQAVKSDILMILTDVEQVFLNYNTDKQQALSSVSLEKCRKYYNEGHFLRGSMGPKILACTRFTEWSGKESIITSLEKASEALEGKAGTRIIP